MNGHGSHGSRPGERRGGRQKGTPNKKTLAMRQAIATELEQWRDGKPDAFKGDAHAYMITVYQDPSKPPELRLEAAKAAARYEKPALSSSTVEVKDAMSAMTAEQLIALAALAPLPLARKASEDGPLH